MAQSKTGKLKNIVALVVAFSYMLMLKLNVTVIYWPAYQRLHQFKGKLYKEPRQIFAITFKQSPQYFIQT